MRVYKGQLTIIIDDEYYKVNVGIPGKFKKGMAYLIDHEVVLPYMGKVKSIKEATRPGIYRINNEIEYIMPDSKQEKIKYSDDNIIETDPDAIFRDISKNRDSFINTDDIEIINNNSEVYFPLINEGDDFLKIIIKKAIQEKKININNYKDKFPNNHALTNMKSGLKRDTKMTVTNFKSWCEVLGLDWEVTLKDSGEDRLSPLKEPITITTDYNINDF